MAIQLLLKEVTIILFVIHVVNRIIAHLFFYYKKIINELTNFWRVCKFLLSKFYFICVVCSKLVLKYNFPRTAQGGTFHTAERFLRFRHL